MKPEYYHGPMFYCAGHPDELMEGRRISRSRAERICAPARAREERGWWSRLTAPGRVEREGWRGPFDQEWQAAEALFRGYGIDPDTGRPLGAEERRRWASFFRYQQAKSLPPGKVSRIPLPLAVRRPRSKKGGGLFGVFFGSRRAA